MQLGLDVGNRLVDQLVASGGGHLPGDHVAGRSDGQGHGTVAHFLDGACLGRGDLVLCGLQAAGDRDFQVGLGLLGRGRRFALGVLDDPVGLFLDFLLLALIAGQKGLL